MTIHLKGFRIPLLAALLATLGWITALPSFGQTYRYEPSSQTVANPARRTTARSAVRVAANEEVVVDGPGVVMGRRGPVPVPPSTPAWQRRSPNFPPQPKMVSHADGPLEPQPEEIGVGRMHKASPSDMTLPPGAVMVDGPDGMMGGDCDSCGGCGSCDSCGGCCDDENDCCLIPCPNWKNLTIFGGVQGFTNPGNRGLQGSFGFSEGFNLGMPLRFCGCSTGLGLQVGLRGVHSNFSGSYPTFTTEERDQLFATIGVFRRVDWGMQGGVVLDYLHDSWWYDIKIAQIRGELSWLHPCNHEVGFFFTASTDNDVFTSDQTASPFIPVGETTYQSTDMYAFFYRYRFDDCCESSGYMRLFGGFTGDRDGLFGGDMLVPLTDRWALQTNFTYLIPAETTDDGGVFNEGWNVGINFVWYPRCNARQGGYYRPLFNVADNGSLIVNEVDN